MYAGEPTPLTWVVSAEIDNAAPKSDIGWFDVPVDDAEAMGEVKRLATLEHQFDSSRQRQEVVHTAILLERAAGHVLHGDVTVLFGRLGVVNRHNVRMAQLSRQGSLGEKQAAKALAQIAVAENLGSDALDGNLAPGERIISKIDHARGPRSDLPDDLVLADSFHVMAGCVTPRQLRLQRPIVAKSRWRPGEIDNRCYFLGKFAAMLRNSLSLASALESW
jgi:hypothetical protein